MIFLSNVSNSINCYILVSWDSKVYNYLLSLLKWITYEMSSLVDGCFFVVTFMDGLNTLAGFQDLWDYFKCNFIAF
jgi:hypothetical protein